MVTSETQKTPNLELWLSILEQNESWSTRHFVCKYMCVDIYCIYTCVRMHAYVCFPTSKRRVNISTPLRRRKKVSVLQVGTLRHQRCSSDLGPDSTSDSAGRRTSGLVLKAGCRLPCIRWRAQLSSNMITVYRLNHLLFARLLAQAEQLHGYLNCSGLL